MQRNSAAYFIISNTVHLAFLSYPSVYLIVMYVLIVKLDRKLVVYLLPVIIGSLSARNLG